MFNSITALENATAKTEAVKEEDKNPLNGAMGRDDFLKLFVEQLKNQDPMNPMDNYEVAAQLAQYSSLEQLVNLNDNFKAFMDMNSQNLYFQGISLIGKTVDYVGNKIQFDPKKESDIDIKFKIDGATPKANINIYDMDDNYIRTIEMENLEKGEHTAKWDGFDKTGNKVKAGIYKYEIIAYDEDGEQLKYTPYGRGSVQNVRFDKENSETVIKVNDNEINITDIIGIGS